MVMCSNDFFVYIPTMHREFLGGALPSCVRTLWPGLPNGRGSHFDPALWVVPAALPFTPDEAAGCMMDLAHLDEICMANPSVSTPGIQAIYRRECMEKEELVRFTRSGGLLEKTAPAVPGLAEYSLLRWAQYYLLLVWLQEERVLEMRNLSAHYRDGVRRLATHIGLDDEEGATLPQLFTDMSAPMFDDTPVFLPSWQFMLGLFSLVLPPEIVLCTDDARMIEAVSSLGKCSALPLELQHFFSETKATISCIHRPAWQLLGRRVPDPDQAWLDTPRTVILLTGE